MKGSCLDVNEAGALRQGCRASFSGRREPCQAGSLLNLRILDDSDDITHIDRPGAMLEAACEWRLGREQAARIKVPDLVAIVGDQQRGLEEPESEVCAVLMSS